MTMPALMQAIATLYRGTDGEASPTLRSAIDVLDRYPATAPRLSIPSSVPVCRLLPDVFEEAKLRPLSGVAAGLCTIVPALHWTRNANYTTDNTGTAFLDNYGYCELIGRNGLWPSETIAIGFLLLGPATFYPAHHHPAAEVYHVVSGTASWWREDHDWTLEPPGAVITHRPRIRHAMRTEAEPLLALYCWTGEVSIAARLG